MNQPPDVPDTWRFSIDVAEASGGAERGRRRASAQKLLLRSAVTMSPDPGGIFDVMLGLVPGGPRRAQNGDGRQFVSWIHEVDFAEAVKWLIEHEGIHRPGESRLAESAAERRVHAGVAKGMGGWGTKIRAARREMDAGDRRGLLKTLEVKGVHVRVRAHDAAAGVAIRAQHEMAYFVGDDVAERDRQMLRRAGSSSRCGRRRWMRGRWWEVRLAEHAVFDTGGCDFLFGHLAREQEDGKMQLAVLVTVLTLAAPSTHSVRTPIPS